MMGAPLAYHARTVLFETLNRVAIPVSPIRISLSSLKAQLLPGILPERHTQRCMRRVREISQPVQGRITLALLPAAYLQAIYKPASAASAGAVSSEIYSPPLPAHP